MPKKILKGFVVVSALFLIVVYFFVLYLKPDYKGEYALEGLNDPVAVHYDKHGVPHIFAENEMDAQMVLGYVHAQDRLWQMELLRRIAPGRLSELFGEKTQEVDRFFLSLDLEDYHEKSVQSLDTTSTAYKLTQSYINGINAFIANGPTPPEFLLLGIEKEPFKIVDMYHVLGYMSFSFAMAHKTDPLLTAIEKRCGTQFLKDFSVGLDAETYDMGNNKKIDILGVEAISSKVSALLSHNPTPPFIGSNAFVLGPEKTQSGKVILENDPHIGYGIPAVWYQAHIQSPDYENYGFYMGGVPFPLLAHNTNKAYGLTMFENDDLDFFVHPEPLKVEEINKTIKVKDIGAASFVLRKTSKGFLLNDVVKLVDSIPQVTMKWVYTEKDNQLLDAIYHLSHAQNPNDFASALSKIHAPGLNVVYGDAKGNIGWWATGSLFERDKGNRAKFISDGQFDTYHYLPFSKNPKSLNPQKSYLVSANQQTSNSDENSSEKSFYEGYYLPDYRAKKIAALIKEKKRLNADDVIKVSRNIQSETLKNTARLLVEILNQKKGWNTFETQLINDLVAWDGVLNKDSHEITFMTRMEYELLNRAIADEMGKDLFDSFLNTHVHKRSFYDLLNNKDAICWDNVNTEAQQEGRTEIVESAFKGAISFLQSQLGPNKATWSWGEVHQLEFKHPFGEIKWLRPIFNRGPYAHHGGNEVVNNQIFDLNEGGGYPIKAGPSTRRVIDFSDIYHAKVTMPMGQSGNVLSKNYDNMIDGFMKEEFHTMYLDKKEIIGQSTLLSFLPVKG